MAQIGWMDFSKAYRQKIGTILDLMKPEGMVDELGIGTIRDAIANQIFPGINTLQTRAKYFFIVPYILFDYLASDVKEKSKKTAAKYLKDQEHEVMWYLAEYYKYQEGLGVIGITKKRNQPILRRPSEIYWGGLNTFKIIDSGGLGVDSYLNQVSQKSFSSLISKLKQGDDIEGDDIDAEFNNLFKININPEPNWFSGLTMDLSHSEADILKDRIQNTVDDKLIGFLLSNDRINQVFKKCNDFMTFSKLAFTIEDIPQHIRNDLLVAHDFSEFIYGAHIVYNFCLQKRYEKNYWMDEWHEWFGQLKQNMIQFENFNPVVLFHPPYSLTTRIKTQQFIFHYWELVRNNINNIEEFTKLIQMQESNVKINKARLQLRKFDDVKEDKWIGLQRLDYRYNNAKSILNDIFNQLDS
ncbi:MAG: DUF6361 family protein [Candidatus Thorarchaeota archaeon]